MNGAFLCTSLTYAKFTEDRGFESVLFCFYISKRTNLEGSPTFQKTQILRFHDSDLQPGLFRDHNMVYYIEGKETQMNIVQVWLES